MAPYTIQAESKQLLKSLLDNPSLFVSPEVKAAAERVEFTGYADPWLPVPVKFSESISAISAFVAAAAVAVAEDRYGIKQDIKVNTYVHALNTTQLIQALMIMRDTLTATVTMLPLSFSGSSCPTSPASPS